jgi:hypothetical protein
VTFSGQEKLPTMSTQQQIDANRQNSLASTGPVSEAGKQTSSQNATKHGFTGLSLVVTPAEREAYTAHVAAYVAHHNPVNHETQQLVRQLADLDWSLHQINVQQLNTISLMNAVHVQSEGNNVDPIETAKVIAGLSRTLTNLNLYEVRRRRAAKSVKEELEAMKAALEDQFAKELPQAAELYKLAKETGESFDPREFGFVCSLDEILLYLRGKQFAAASKLTAKK